MNYLKINASEKKANFHYHKEKNNTRQTKIRLPQELLYNINCIII